MGNPFLRPEAATIGELVAAAREMSAGSMKLAGSDGDGKTVFLVLIAVDEEARRLEPEVERITAEQDAPKPSKRGGRRG